MSSTARKNSPKKQQENLAVLEKFAKTRGLKVSSGKLLYAGLRLKAGTCTYRDEPWLILDKGQPYEEQLDLFREAFQELNITDLPDEVRTVLDEEEVHG
jgi:hypothetical protein